MAPEQARDSRATSERSDIYSLGCTFYFLLTGSPPFPGGDIADKLSRHCTKPPPDPCEIRPDVPGPLGLLVRKMMAKRPENRFATTTSCSHASRNIAAQRVDRLRGLDRGAGRRGRRRGGHPAGPDRVGESRGDRGGQGAAAASRGTPQSLGDRPRRTRRGGRAPPRPAAASSARATPGARREAGSPPTTIPSSSLDELDERGSSEGDDDDELVEDLARAGRSPGAEPGAKAHDLKWIYAGVGGCVALSSWCFVDQSA